MMTKNKIYLALFVFTITFCMPALIINAIKTYGAAGQEVGRIVYEVTHEN